MEKIILNRFRRGLDCTLGYIEIKNHIFYTLELPWKFNRVSQSCIPCGVYLCEFDQIKNKVHINDVEGRTFIQIHVGNSAKDIEGCILIGNSIGKLSSQNAVLSSTDAFGLFRDCLNSKSFELIIKEL